MNKKRQRKSNLLVNIKYKEGIIKSAHIDWILSHPQVNDSTISRYRIRVEVGRNSNRVFVHDNLLQVSFMETPQRLNIPRVLKWFES